LNRPLGLVQAGRAHRHHGRAQVMLACGPLFRVTAWSVFRIRVSIDPPTWQRAIEPRRHVGGAGLGGKLQGWIDAITHP